MNLVKTQSVNTRLELLTPPSLELAERLSKIPGVVANVGCEIVTIEATTIQLLAQIQRNVEFIIYTN